VPFMS